MSRSIDGPECIHGHNLFDPTPCPKCQGSAVERHADLYAHPAFARVFARADELMAQRRPTSNPPGMNAPYGRKSWPELTGSGNPEVGDYAAGLEVANTPEMDKLHALTRLYVKVLVRLLMIQQERAFLRAFYRGSYSETATIDPAVFKSNLFKPEPVAVHCTACGRDEPGPECKTCEVAHCPIRPLLKSKPKHAAKRAVKSLKSRPKRKTYARKK